LLAAGNLIHQNLLIYPLKGGRVTLTEGQCRACLEQLCQRFLEGCSPPNLRFYQLASIALLCQKAWDTCVSFDRSCSFANDLVAHSVGELQNFFLGDVWGEAYYAPWSYMDIHAHCDFERPCSIQH